jgi:hypothetical protein
MSAVGVMRKQTIGSLCCFGVADFSSLQLGFNSPCVQETLFLIFLMQRHQGCRLASGLWSAWRRE